MSKDQKKAIAFLSGGIGDQLFHFSQLQALSADLGSPIDIACRHHLRMKEITLASDWAGQLIDIDDLRHLIRLNHFLASVHLLRAKAYSAGFILHKSTSFKLAAMLARIPQRIGFADNIYDRFLLTKGLSLQAGGARRQLWGHRPYIASMDSYLLEQNIDYMKTAPIQPTLNASKTAQAFLTKLPRPLLLVNLFSLDESRRWPIEHALQMLCACMRICKGSILLSAGRDARQWHGDLMNRWPSDLPAIIDLSADIDNLETEIGIYHHADLYIGVDSFTSNLAMNCDLPALILFAKEHDKLGYRPYTQGLAPKISGKLDNITKDDFFSALDRLLPAMFD